MMVELDAKGIGHYSFSIFASASGSLQTMKSRFPSRPSY
jgi:hypothetical protein